MEGRVTNSLLAVAQKEEKHTALSHRMEGSIPEAICRALIQE
jgi:hypothetical protein